MLGRAVIFTAVRCACFELAHYVRTCTILVPGGDGLRENEGRGRGKLSTRPLRLPARPRIWRHAGCRIILCMFSIDLSVAYGAVIEAATRQRVGLLYRTSVKKRQLCAYGA